MFRRIAAISLAALSFNFGLVARPAVKGDEASGAGRHIDQLLQKELFQSLPASQLAPCTNDETFLRRAYLDLVGELPSPSEITAFVLEPAANKRDQVVDRLLADPRFGRNWARYWRDVVMYRRADERALLSANAMTEYLTEQFNKGTSWDVIAKAFIEATGDVRENGRTALIMAQMGDANEVASETSRIFMGVQIQCAQCHNHPTDRWKRDQFHEFAAFFPRISVRPTFSEGRVRGFAVASTDFAPRFQRPGGQMRGSLEHYMPDLKDPSSQGKLMAPVFFATGRKLETGTPDLDRRETLADWLTSKENHWFSKAFVNRIWAELVGEGFYEPIDDIGPDRRCSAPQTIEYLSTEFAKLDYDVKWLYRTIASTEAYQRESRPRRNPEQTPFTANCSQRLRGDQVLDVLAAALGLDIPAIQPGGYGAGGFRGFAVGPRAQFNGTFGFDPSVRRDEVTGSIPQALMLMNTQLVSSAVNARSGGTMLGQLLAGSSDNEEVTVELFLRCLAREPQTAELAACLAFVEKSGDRAEAFEDILWALVNRAEFIYRN